MTEPGKPFAWTLEGFVPGTNLFACGTVYRRAAKAVAIALEQEGSDGSLAAYPLVFLYRHAVEACVKGVLVLFGQPIDISAKQVRDRGHDLSKQMADLDRVSKSASRPLSRRTLRAIHSFNAIDPKGTMFRYDDVMQYRGVFDLKHFCDEIESVLGELEELYCELRLTLLAEVEDREIEN
jgi:hypothetical protein